MGSLTDVLKLDLSLTGSKLLTLSISGGSLRFAAFSGKRVERWHVAPFNPTFLRGDVVSDPNGLGQVIKAVTARLGLRNRKLVAAFPGARSLPRIIDIPIAGDVVPSEIIPQQARRVLGAAIENSYLYWQPLYRKGPKLQAYYVLAVPKDAVEGFTQAIQGGGFKPYKTELSGFALARAMGVRTGILVNVQSGTVEMVVVVNAQPMLLYADTLPNGAANDLVAGLSDRLQQLISYHNERSRDGALAADAPIYVSGDAPLEEAAVQELASAAAHPVAVAPPPPGFRYPQGFDPSAFMINLGLALK
ncbi:MAG: hypothetical protein HYX97_06315 [Chloroflexi bacterium]|nr:hypothetical protein [Chloroflexota bacterium]